MNQAEVMKILVIYPTPFFSPISLDNYTRLMSILDAGIEVDLLTFPDGDDIKHPKLNLLRYPQKPLFKEIETGQYKKIFIYSVLLFYKVALLKKKNYSLIYTSGTMTPFLWILRYFSSVKVCAYIISTLEDELIKWRITNNKLLYKTFRKWDLYSQSMYHYLIFYQQATLERIIKRGYIRDNAFLIEQSASIPENNANYRQIHKDRFTVLYTGTFVQVQNVELLIDIASELASSGVVIQMIGANETEYAHYINIIKLNKLTDVIELYPRMLPQELKPYIQAADVMISPRTFGYDTPMKIFYYLHYGKCIIATDYPIHNIDLNDEAAILVPDNAKLIAAKILELKDNPQIIKEKENAAKQLYLQKYSRELQVAHYRDFFQKITGTNQESDQHRPIKT